MRCSSRTCPEFAPTWARDTRRRLLENLRVAGLTVMFSVTAPGAEVFPFDPSALLTPGRHKVLGTDRMPRKP